MDAVVDGAWGELAIEVKTGRFAQGEIRGLLEFTRRHPAYRPLVVCDPGQEAAVRRTGVDAVSWPAFLLSGPDSRQ